MESFQELFEKSAGQPVKYRGVMIQLMDRIPVSYDRTIRIAFEAVYGQWRQGIHLSADGVFIVNGEAIRNAIVLWSDTAPTVVDVSVRAKSSTVIVKNVWDVGDGVVHSWHNGAAMIVESDGAIRRYRCNDGFADDDFDDIVFSIDLEPQLTNIGGVSE